MSQTQGNRTISREKLVEELLSSESAHVASLTTLVSQYVEPLRRAKPSILEKEDMQAMFSNLEVLRLWNLALLDGLRTHLEYGNTFGDLFVEMIPLLRQLYSQYSENYERAMITYERLKSNKAFSSWLDQRQVDTGDPRDLRSYLFLPIQRMIAYTSLLQGILALTPEGHDDFIHLVSALQALRSASAHADALAVQRKNIDHLLMLHNRFSDGTQIALPHRRFIHEGPVVLHLPTGALKDRHMFMFNDIVLLAKPRKKSRFATDFSLPLDSLRVEDVKDSKHGRYQIRIISSRSSATEHLISTSDKDQWLAILQTKPDHPRPAAPYSRPADDDLLQRIFQWAQMEDPVLVHVQIRQFTHSLIAPLTPSSSSSSLTSTTPPSISPSSPLLVSQSTSPPLLGPSTSSSPPPTTSPSSIPRGHRSRLSPA